MLFCLIYRAVSTEDKYRHSYVDSMLLHLVYNVFFDILQIVFHSVHCNIWFSLDLSALLISLSVRYSIVFYNFPASIGYPFSCSS